MCCFSWPLWHPHAKVEWMDSVHKGELRTFLWGKDNVGCLSTHSEISKHHLTFKFIDKSKILRVCYG